MPDPVIQALASAVMSRNGRVATLVISLATPLLIASEVAAHSGGRPGGGCIGCHASGDHEVVVTLDDPTLNPGQETTFTILLGGSGQAAGLFVDAGGQGELELIGGEGLSQVPSGLTHNSPKQLSGGDTTFRFRWTAPNQVGAARFELSSLITNGNGSSNGDQAMHTNYDVVFGCEPREYFRDDDGDGFGRSNAPLQHCADAVPEGYAAAPGDCDDSRDSVYPDAQEFCNQRDDDCDDEIDENALPLMQWPDADGDGFFGLEEGQSEDTFLGCVPTDGYAAEAGDCAPDDAGRNPGMEEICNGFDDNCDFEVDEGVKPRCGEGWCRREAFTCDEATCYPGDARPEECNLLDDDCDGELDEGSCPEGEACVAFECVPVEDQNDTDPATSDPTNGGTAGGDAGGDVTSDTLASGGATGASDTDTAGLGEAGNTSGCSCTAPRGAPGPWWLVLAGFALALRPGRRRRPL